MAMIKFELVTLDGIKFSEDVHEVRLPTPQGEIGVFKDHAPLVSIASEGVITVRRKPDHTDKLLEYFATNGGVIEVIDNGVRVLVDEAAQEDEISEKEAEEALKLAQKMQAEAHDQVSLEKAQQLIQRQRVNLKVAGLRRRKKH